MRRFLVATLLSIGLLVWPGLGLTDEEEGRPRGSRARPTRPTCRHRTTW